MAAKTPELRDVDFSRLPEGLYELNESFQNPKADRRVKYDWRKRATISSGIYEVQSLAKFWDEETLQLLEAKGADLSKDIPVQITKKGAYQPLYYRENPELFLQLMDRLNPAGESLETVIARHRVDGYHQPGLAAIRVLLASGKINLRDVDQALAKAFNGDDE